MRASPTATTDLRWGRSTWSTQGAKIGLRDVPERGKPEKPNKTCPHWVKDGRLTKLTQEDGALEVF